MNRIIEILCRRDNIGVREAAARLQAVQDYISNYNPSYDELEEIMMDELGLEMDYLMDLL